MIVNGPWKETPSTDECFVYVIARLDECEKVRAPVKVGITTNPNERLGAIRTSSPHKVDFAWKFKFRSVSLAEKIEARFHRENSAHRLNGEWFDIDPLEAIRGVCAVVKSVFADKIKRYSAELEADYFRSSAWKAEYFARLLIYEEAYCDEAKRA